jgi:hypothetical protein
VRYAAAVLVILLSLYAGSRVYGNLETRDQVPAACQLMGGKWGIWSGWDCY